MNVLVLMGGISTERDVSLNTGKAVAEALAQAGHTVTSYDLNPQAGRDVLDLANSAALRQARVVFIALHGGEGEDGRIQAVLELLGKPYTGSGVRASAVCMDKSITKIIFEKHDIPTPAWAHLRGGAADVEHAEQAIPLLGGLPAVIKPVDQGSTIGISIVHDLSGLEGAISLARRYSAGLILEKYIEGRELSVPIIEDRVYPVIEIKPRDGFYDYERKYTKGMTVYEYPAAIDRRTCQIIEDNAMKAYQVLGCENFARVDVRLGKDGVAYFLEANTVPGMTETSLVPMGAKARGMTFPQLVDRIVSYALKRAGLED